MHKAYCKLKGIKICEIYFFGHSNKPQYIHIDGDGIGDSGHSNGFGGKEYGGGFEHSHSVGNGDGFGHFGFFTYVQEDVDVEYSEVTFCKTIYMEDEVF